MKGWSVSFLLMMILACAEKQRAGFELPLNAPLIIASNEGRTWKVSEKYQDGNRVTLSNCDSLYTISFRLDGSVKSDYPDMQQCEKGYNGKWRILREKDGHPYLQIAEYQDQDTVVVKLLIDDLTPDRLEYQLSKRKSNGIRTTIRKVLIPQQTN